MSILTDQGANTYLPSSPVAPSFLLISAITRSLPMVITVSGQIPENIYVVGQTVYLSIPFTFGMYQANALTVEIIEVNGFNFSVNVDSTQFDPFVIPAFGKEAPATLSPQGSRNIYNFTTLPFHSINGLVGN
jgi:hypothetical protein